MIPTRGEDKIYLPKIIVCEDINIYDETFNNTVIHELIHAYDVCRAKINYNDCKQYACLEIRAAALRLVCLNIFYSNLICISKFPVYYYLLILL